VYAESFKVPTKQGSAKESNSQQTFGETRVVPNARKNVKKQISIHTSTKYYTHKTLQGRGTKAGKVELQDL